MLRCRCRSCTDLLISRRDLRCSASGRVIERRPELPQDIDGAAGESLSEARSPQARGRPLHTAASVKIEKDFFFGGWVLDDLVDIGVVHLFQSHGVAAASWSRF